MKKVLCYCLWLGFVFDAFCMEYNRESDENIYEEGLQDAFYDCVVIINKHHKFFGSKIYLSWSTYFSEQMSKEEDQREFFIEIPEAQVESLIYVLYMNLNIKKGSDNSWLRGAVPLLKNPVEAMYLAGVVLKFPSMVKEIAKQYLLDEQRDNYRIHQLALPDEFVELSKDKDFLKHVVEPVGEILLKIYPSTHEMASKIENFSLLPFLAVLSLVKNDKLKVDSENSVFYLVCAWMQQDKSRVKYLRELLSHIRYPYMSNFFILQIVPQVADLFDDIEVKQYILESKKFGIEAMVGKIEHIEQVGQNKFPGRTNQLITRHSFLPNNSQRLQFNATHKLPNICKSSKPYQYRYFFCGYDILFVVQKQRIDESNPSYGPGNSTLMAHLECKSKILPAGHNHLLPVQFTVKVAITDLGPRNLIFLNGGKAFSMQLTKKDQNWSRWLIKGSLEITVSVELLPFINEAGNFTEIE
jgi:hypothetical protein